MKNTKDNLINTIHKALPQLQCKKCTYDDCKSYAVAIVKNNEAVDKCEPGSTKTKNQLLETIQIYYISNTILDSTAANKSSNIKTIEKSTK